MMAGQRIAGRYEIGSRLGLGGMSTVYEAFDTRLERHVAVKLLAEHLAEDEQFVARFRREALAAARLVHPNIVQVFDFGLDEDTGRHYIVMERIAGPSGALVLREKGRLAVDEAVDWIAQACRGLEYAHRNGVVHRDVKPGNLLRSEGDETVKIADFGIAKAASDESSITQVGSVLGTAAYLAPEQAAGEDAGPAADIYGLGVVAYQLLSGRLPYEAQSLTELALKQQREVPTPLHVVDPAIPIALSAAVARALELNPRRRWPSAEAMRQAMLDGARGVGDTTMATQIAGRDETAATTVFAGEPAAAPVVVPRRPREPAPGRHERASAPPPQTASDRRAERRRERRRRRRIALRRLTTFLVLVIVLAGVAAAVYFATAPGKATVHLRDVMRNDTNQVIDALQSMIDDNTR